MSDEYVANHVRNLVAMMGFDMRKSLRDRDLELEAKVMDKLMELGLSSTDSKKPLERFLKSGCLLASLYYRHHPTDAKVYTAIHAILLLGVDDYFSDVSLTRTFAHKFGTRKAQGHPLLDCVARLLRDETPKIFGPFTTNMIITSTLDGINGFSLEATFPRGFLRAMPGFSCWLRSCTGWSAAYACFIFPNTKFPESEYLGRYVQIMPNLRDIICYVNDILSFYKERVVAKEGCFISNLAQEKSMDDYSTLALVCDYVLSLDKEIREFLAEDEIILGAYADFMLGYMEWHFQVERYRLNELGLTLKS
ncbi:trichodiene synthase [Trichoderma reesei QM6a]|uniref:Trichodiene synthase n=1 Tax=Hypocrea jecorina (strain QM6a) TaxID=431241 RepID=G0RHI5_HYPJQ|nr:trichodiene synthase [Trichoderma reesei QM6a]EGR49373.1 trichodiene synthase [Trichoderma reesei QM6a]